MNLHRNVLAIVAGAALIASLPVGAQVLGGSLDGAANGTFGGTLGGAGVNGAGAGSVSGHAGVDASDSFGAARARARQTAGEGRDVAIGAYGATSSRVDSARGTAGATVDTTHSAGARASRRAARAASETRSSTSIGHTSAAQADTGSNGGLFANGAGEARTEQRAMGRSIAAEGAAGSQMSADRSGLASSGYGEAGLSMNKPQHAAPEPTPAPADSDPSVQQ
jgi:hypothetical protein